MVRFCKNMGLIFGWQLSFACTAWTKTTSSSVPWLWGKSRISPQGRLKYQTINVLISANLACRARGSCASCTRTTWSTSETEPRRVSRSASTSSDRGGGTAALWTTHLCLDGSCRLVSSLFDETSGAAQGNVVIVQHFKRSVNQYESDGRF